MLFRGYLMKLFKKVKTFNRIKKSFRFFSFINLFNNIVIKAI